MPLLQKAIYDPIREEQTGMVKVTRGAEKERQKIQEEEVQAIKTKEIVKPTNPYDIVKKLKT